MDYTRRQLELFYKYAIQLEVYARADRVDDFSIALAGQGPKFAKKFRGHHHG